MLLSRRRPPETPLGLSRPYCRLPQRLRTHSQVGGATAALHRDPRGLRVRRRQQNWAELRFVRPTDLPERPPVILHSHSRTSIGLCPWQLLIAIPMDSKIPACTEVTGSRVHTTLVCSVLAYLEEGSSEYKETETGINLI